LAVREGLEPPSGLSVKGKEKIWWSTHYFLPISYSTPPGPGGLSASSNTLH